MAKHCILLLLLFAEAVGLQITVISTSIINALRQLTMINFKINFNTVIF